MGEERNPTKNIPEIQSFIDNVKRFSEEHRDDKDEYSYGHAVRCLAQSVIEVHRRAENEEAQREILRNKALNVIFRYGKNIIPLLRDDLKLSLSKEDWEKYKDLD